MSAKKKWGTQDAFRTHKALLPFSVPFDSKTRTPKRELNNFSSQSVRDNRSNWYHEKVWKCSWFRSMLAINETNISYAKLCEKYFTTKDTSDRRMEINTSCVEIYMVLCCLLGERVKELFWFWCSCKAWSESIGFFLQWLSRMANNRMKKAKANKAHGSVYLSCNFTKRVNTSPRLRTIITSRPSGPVYPNPESIWHHSWSTQLVCILQTNNKTFCF